MRKWILNLPVEAFMPWNLLCTARENSFAYHFRVPLSSICFFPKELRVQPHRTCWPCGASHRPVRQRRIAPIAMLELAQVGVHRLAEAGHQLIHLCSQLLSQPRKERGKTLCVAEGETLGGT